MYNAKTTGRNTVIALALGSLFGVSEVAMAAGTAGASFTDPTARLAGAGTISKGALVYIGPFATLTASSGRVISIGDTSNVQDNVTVSATRGNVTLGNAVILAHGATVLSGSTGASLGKTGTCPGGITYCPSFVSFNATVDGAIIQKDAMVSALARVGPGVTIPSGRKVLPGKNVTANSQVASKTVPVTEGDREFMAGVIHVNTSFAETYTNLAAESSSNVRGINYDPGYSDFNMDRNLPTLNGVATQDPAFRNRIIGDVRMHDTLEDLDDAMGNDISLRADEGESFEIGIIDTMEDRVTLHALEHSHLHLGDAGVYGLRSIVHGGATPFANTTITGDNLDLGTQAVFFRSRIGNDSSVGSRSVVQDSDLPPGTNIPANTIVVANAVFGKVEW